MGTMLWRWNDETTGTILQGAAFCSKAIGAGTAAWGDWFQLFFATAMAVLAIFLVVEGAQTFAKQMKEKKAKKAA